MWIHNITPVMKTRSEECYFTQSVINLLKYIMNANLESSVRKDAMWANESQVTV